MDTQAFLEICRRLLRHPAVAYHEHAVRAEAEAICAEAALKARRDRFGNLLVELSNAPGSTTVVLSAHLDHPGFEVVRPAGDGSYIARFRGGVPDHYFTPGLKLWLMPGRVPATLGERTEQEKHFTVNVDTAAALPCEPEFAVWRMADFQHRGDRITARACDDLIGVSSVLATLIDLKRSGANVNVIGAITRAEEVGFHGALALAAEKGLPADALVISLETSKELPGVEMGKGVILRVGDKASIFDSTGTRYLAEVAEDLRKARPGFSFQRALMSGGTCEATAYQEYGYRSVAVCVALGNYHNCGANGIIKPEYVSLSDALSMIELLKEVAMQVHRYDFYVDRLRSRLKNLLAEAQHDLPGSA